MYKWTCIHKCEMLARGIANTLGNQSGQDTNNIQTSTKPTQSYRHVQVNTNLCKATQWSKVWPLTAVSKVILEVSTLGLPLPASSVCTYRCGLDFPKPSHFSNTFIYALIISSFVVSLFSVVFTLIKYSAVEHSSTEISRSDLLAAPRSSRRWARS